MVDEDEIAQGRFKRWLKEFGLGTLFMFLVAVAIGFIAAHVDHPGRFGYRSGIILGVMIVAILVTGYFLVKQVLKPTGEAPLTPKERLNRNILVACGLLGGAIGLVMAFGSQGGIGDGGVFSNAPLEPWVAVVLLLVIGVFLPILSILWHRTVDEQETDAYKTGAVYGFYIYGIGAPVWWLAWRGGFVPEPNGILIYFVTVLAVGAVWTWKKYA